MGVEPDEEFVSDDELKSLLGRWNAPGPSRVLDKRIVTSFNREFSGADGLSQSVLLPHRREEVVLMKFCTRCEEEFAEKFSFCPVDGTPLTAVEAKKEELSVTVVKDPSVTLSKPKPEPWVDNTEPIIRKTPTPSSPQPTYAASSALGLREEYHLTIMDDSGLVARLSHELKDVSHEYELTWPEFKRDPFGFTKRAFFGYGQKLKKFLANRNILIAIGGAMLAMLALVGAVMFM